MFWKTFSSGMAPIVIGLFFFWRRQSRSSSASWASTSAPIHTRCTIARSSSSRSGSISTDPDLPVPAGDAAAAPAAGHLWLSAGSLAVCVAAFLFTWTRLFVGMDVKDEAYDVVLPWRWVLGERPFSHEHTLFQLPALLEYPFLKLFGLVRGNDPTGLILYTRHLYLLMMLGVALAVFQLTRHLCAGSSPRRSPRPRSRSFSGRRPT